MLVKGVTDLWRNDKVNILQSRNIPITQLLIFPQRSWWGEFTFPLLKHYIIFVDAEMKIWYDIVSYETRKCNIDI